MPASSSFIAVILDWQKLGREGRLIVMDGDETAVADVLRTGLYATYELRASCPGEVFEILNIAHPEDYRLRSLSVGDCVVDGEGKVHVVKGIGWATLPLPAAEYGLAVPVEH